MNEAKRQALIDVFKSEYGIYSRSGEVSEAAFSAASLVSSAKSFSDMRELQSAINLLSRGENAVIFDEYSNPSIMSRACGYSAGGKEIWVGKYISSMHGESACSLPMSAPLHGVSYDAAAELCRKKGSGFALTPFGARMSIAKACRKSGFLPDGNNDAGHDYFSKEQRGTLCGEGTTLTGSGPVLWAHDKSPAGIFDLNGNVNEWDSGFRLMDGKIQLIDESELFSADADFSASSPLWRSVDTAGKLIAPDEKGALCFDAQGGGIRLTDSPEAEGLGNCAFSALTASEGLKAPEILVRLGLYPEEDRSGYGHGWRWISTKGECLPLCGGAYRAVDHAGVFFCGTTHPRTMNYELTGFRIAYCGKENFL